MAVPKFDALMGPILSIASDGGDYSYDHMSAAAADRLGLGDDERQERMASGKLRLNNRIFWATLHLVQAKALDRSGPGVVRITDRGRALASANPTSITVDDLAQFPEYRDFRARSKGSTHKVQLADKEVTVVVPQDGHEISAPEQSGTRESIRMQMLLADIGSRMGMDVWLPRNDKNAVLSIWKGEHPEPLKSLPLNYDDTTLQTIEQIDVLWLKGRSIRRAFEVEHTTAVYSGLLRMADLLALQPNMQIKLHIVAPEPRRDKVFQELRRPVFTYLERGPLSECCTYLSYESVNKLTSLPHLGHVTDDVLDEYAEDADPNG